MSGDFARSATKHKTRLTSFADKYKKVSHRACCKGSALHTEGDAAAEDLRSPRRVQRPLEQKDEVLLQCQRQFGLCHPKVNYISVPSMDARCVSILGTPPSVPWV